MPRSARSSLPLLIALMAPCAAAAEPPLNAAVRGLVARHRLGRARVGVCAVHLDSGRVLCSLDADRALVPASNMKLATTAVALRLLGAKHEFKTAVYAMGPVANRRLNGDLLVVADGDPAISGREHDGDTTAVFDRWAAAVARSARSVSGNLIIDVSAFDRQYVHPNWPQDQLIRWYCAPISAFALNDNCIDVKVRPGERPGQPATVRLDPPTAYFRVRNRCETVANAARPRAVISRSPRDDTLLISGELTPTSPGAAAPVAVKHPQRFAATVLLERLAKAGVKVEGKLLLAVRPIAVGDRKSLITTRHSLTNAIATANKRSQNFYAEMIFKTLGRRAGEPATFGTAALIVTHELVRMGLPAGEFTVDDGSGMSRKNELAPAHVVTVLQVMAAGPHARAYIGSLALAGTDGTMKKRLKEAPCKGAVRAKTGHLRGVSALSGYARSKRGLVAFSILTNGPVAGVGDRFQDAVCRLLVGFAP
jgi:PBP4 family serine-type D-alanyl-D-alanine carboxypeptidase